MTHPYGVKTLTADGFGVINDTVTIGAVPLQFQLALAGPVGPTFLTWDTAPPAGFIGDAATPHPITEAPAAPTSSRWRDHSCRSAVCRRPSSS